MGEYLFATFFVPLYLNPLIAIWMTLSYTAKGSGRKKHFARWCFGLALLSAAFYDRLLSVIYWRVLPDVRIDGIDIGTFISETAPTFSPLFCIAVGHLFIRKLRRRLPDEYALIDVSRLIRLGVMVGHGAISLVIGFSLSS